MPFRYTFTAIGTSWAIDIPADVDDEEKIREAINSRISIFDKTYSRFREDSLVSEMSRKSGRYTLPEDALPMLSLYRELYELTGGSMTPLIGNTLVDAGYDAKYSLSPKTHVGKPKSWEEVIEYAHPILEIKTPVLLDFGAIGKGYLIDLVSDVLKENDICEYTINAGGDIKYLTVSGKPLRVGLENPENKEEVVGVAEISNQSICGSAGNKRVWDKYHHIIDAYTTESPRHILGLWVVADTTKLADALTTALFFVEPEVLLNKYKFEYVIIYKDHTARVSEKFPGKLFI